MSIARHYLVLRQTLKDQPNGEEVPLTISRLTEIWNCTPRHVKSLLRHMEQSGWIGWKPGRGRGRASRMTFRLSPYLPWIREALSSRAGQTGAWPGLRKLLAETDRMTEEEKAVLAEGLFAYPPQKSVDSRSGKTGLSRADVLRFPTYRQVGGLDPLYATRRTEMHMASQLYDTWVRFDEDSPEGIAPHLAAGWVKEEDARQWMFYLKKGVRFHDGSLLTAEHAAQSLERLRRAGDTSPYGWIAREIQEIRTPDARTLAVRLSNPNHAFAHFLGALGASITGSPPADGEGGSRNIPLGTGPFRSPQQTDDLFGLEATPDYFRGRVFLDRIELWVMPELYGKSREDAELEVNGTNFLQYRYAKGVSEGWGKVEEPDLGCKALSLNASANGPLQDPALRWLLTDELGRNLPIRETGRNWKMPAYRLFRTGVYTPEGHRPEPDRDPAIGIRPFQRPLRLHTYPGAGNESDAEWLCRFWRERGLQAETVLRPYEELMSPEGLSAADLVLFELPYAGEPEVAYMGAFDSRHSPLNRHLPAELRSKWEVTRRDCLNEPDRAKRLQLLTGHEEILLREWVVLPLYRNLQTAYFPPEWQKVGLSPFGWVDYRWLWLKP